MKHTRFTEPVFKKTICLKNIKILTSKVVETGANDEIRNCDKRDTLWEPNIDYRYLLFTVHSQQITKIY